MFGLLILVTRKAGAARRHQEQGQFKSGSRISRGSSTETATSRQYLLVDIHASPAYLVRYRDESLISSLKHWHYRTKLRSITLIVIALPRGPWQSEPDTVIAPPGQRHLP